LPATSLNRCDRDLEPVAEVTADLSTKSVVELAIVASAVQRIDRSSAVCFWELRFTDDAPTTTLPAAFPEPSMLVSVGARAPARRHTETQGRGGHRGEISNQR
jgi:hypothetical protein